MAASNNYSLGLLGFFFAALTAILIGYLIVPNTTWGRKYL